MVDASTRAFYGDALPDTEPTVIHDFLEFDEHSWTLLLQYPSFLAKIMSAPRERERESLISLNVMFCYRQRGKWMRPIRRTSGQFRHRFEKHSERRISKVGAAEIPQTRYSPAEQWYYFSHTG